MYILYVAVSLFFLVQQASAQAITLTLSTRSINNTLSVAIENNSHQKVFIDSLSIEVDTQKYRKNLLEYLAPSIKKEFTFTIRNPNLPGAYPLITTLRYIHKGELLSMHHVSRLSFNQEVPLRNHCIIEETAIHTKGALRISTSKAGSWRLIVPEEARITSVSRTDNLMVVHIKSKIKGFANQYPLFALLEETHNGIHYTDFCKGTLFLITDEPSENRKGRIPSPILFSSMLFFFAVALLVSFKELDRQRLPRALFRYTSRMLFITLFYLIFKNIDRWLTYSLRYIHWKPYHTFTQVLIDNVNGGNFHNFFQYFIDPYVIGCALLLFPYFYWFDTRKIIEQDKYASVMKTLLSLPNTLTKKRLYWNKNSKLGILTIIIKCFFIPLMVSWSINSFTEISSSLRSFQWNFLAVNAFLVQLFILVDTTIFSFRYLTESEHLKNEIRSVEPTVLGWIVCLWCYPPFNSFTFRPFDFYILRINIAYPSWVHPMATIVITALWGIFVWASVALGFKASNLTNRGIVTRGPYRFCRHPAYMAKVSIWLIQGLFFGQFGIFILFGFILIYWVRAWTEERHLSLDPDYIAYKKKVRWWFIPGIV